MATAMAPLQSAVYSKLNAAPSLAGRVYDQVPEPAPFPFITIGSITEFPDDSHDAQGLNALVTIHVWSQAPGASELYDLFAAVDAALDRVPLTVTGFRDVFIKHTQHQTLDDPDPRTRHLNAQYRVHMTKE
ncbi:DUF3168 domain-containing protein [Streptomyces sp. NPDC014864]|uniref:DUF3168 domain-containing protein n=1 Tax=Streptomyces sp. NPDC014864 TaxID=3364924 RepID=UPI0036F874BE